MHEASPPLVATPYASVVKLLTLSGAGPKDVLVDLGSGDGAIPILGVLVFGVKKAVGVELDPVKVAKAMVGVSKLGLGEDRLELLQGDMYSFDLNGSTLVTIFQSQEAIEKLLGKLMRELVPGTRVVSYLLPLGMMSPLKMVKPAKVAHPFYLYKAPLAWMKEKDATRLLEEISRSAEGSEKEWALVSSQQSRL